MDLGKWERPCLSKRMTSMIHTASKPAVSRRKEEAIKLDVELVRTSVLRLVLRVMKKYLGRISMVVVLVVQLP